MYEENRILSKIEQLVDKLPYRSVWIEVELPDKTVVLTKDRQRPIGFLSDSKWPASYRQIKYFLTEATVSILEIVAFFIPIFAVVGVKTPTAGMQPRIKA